MIVCVSGHNRSGTTMMVEALRRAGLDFGRYEDLDPTVLENMAYRQVSSRALAKLGPGKAYDLDWGEEGVFAEAWDAFDRELLPEVEAWKDPQAALLALWWMRKLPRIKWVIMMRHPLECVRSMGGDDEDSGALLWALYYRRVLATIPEDSRLIVQYERVLAEPELEFEWVLDFLDLDADPEKMAAVVERGKRRYEA